jgi:hypothetical protein
MVIPSIWSQGLRTMLVKLMNDDALKFSSVTNIYGLTPVGVVFREEAPTESEFVCYIFFREIL